MLNRSLSEQQALLECLFFSHLTSATFFVKKRLNYRLWHVPFTEKCVFEWLHKSQGVLKKSLIISIGVERENSIDLCVFSCFQKKPALFSFGNRRREEGEKIIILWLCVWVQFKYSLKPRFSQSHISVVLWQIIC